MIVKRECGKRQLPCQLVEINMLFLVLCPMAEDMRKAGLLVRLLARAIDLVLILAVAKMLPQAGLLAGLAYLLVSDGLFDGQSAGKKIVNLYVREESGCRCSVRASVLRNAPLALSCVVFQIPMFGWLLAPAVLGFELLMMIGNAEGKRLGDLLAGTAVVECRTGFCAPGKSDI